MMTSIVPSTTGSSVLERKIPVSGHVMKEKAEKFAAALDIEDFHCSNGWIDRFKHCHNLKFKTIIGEKGDMNIKTTSNWLRDVYPALVEKYNADKTGLFYQTSTKQNLGK